MFRRFYLLMIFSMTFSCLGPVNAFATSGVSPWAPLLDAAFEQNDLEMAVLVLVNNNHVPVSNVIEKAREKGFGNTRIIDALVDTELTCEQVIIEALQNNLPPIAIFNSDKICGDEYGYTPDSILRLLVKELRFIKTEKEELGEKEENAKIKQKNLEVILVVCKSMMDDKDYTKFDVIHTLCEAGANNETVTEASERFDVPTATALKACPRHAEYGHAYISHELPQEAHIVIGVDHLTIDANGGNGVISPKRP